MTLPAVIRMLSIAALVAMSGCQSVVRTQIETFRNESASAQGGTVKVVPYAKEAEESLEFQHYRRKLEERLAGSGFTPVRDGQADYRARLGFGVSRQEKDQPNSRVFLTGHLGYGVGRYPYTGVYLADGVGRDYEYVRQVSLAIDRFGEDSGKGKIVQVEATSIGHCSHLTVVYDEMLEAIFSNLMRGDGSVERVSVKGGGPCPRR